MCNTPTSILVLTVFMEVRLRKELNISTWTSVILYVITGAIVRIWSTTEDRSTEDPKWAKQASSIKGQVTSRSRSEVRLKIDPQVKYWRSAQRQNHSPSKVEVEKLCCKNVIIYMDTHKEEDSACSSCRNKLK